MPARISAELAHLARLARDGGLDLSEVSLRVKADLLMSMADPPAADLAALGEMAEAMVPALEEKTALLLARKLAAWPHAPRRALSALAARGGEVLVALVSHGMPLDKSDTELFASHDDPNLAVALASRRELSPSAIQMLAGRGDDAVDAALIANRDIALPYAASELLIQRARSRPEQARGLLARADLTHTDLAPLFLLADRDRREAILDSLAAWEAVSPLENRPRLTQDALNALYDLAGSASDIAFAALARPFGGGELLAQALALDETRELAALAMKALGATPEEATRFLIRLGDATAQSIDRIFALVALMRAVRSPVAYRLVMTIAGLDTGLLSRKGQHQPAMDPSGTPARKGAARPEREGIADEIMRTLGAKRGGS